MVGGLCHKGALGLTRAKTLLAFHHFLPEIEQRILEKECGEIEEMLLSFGRMGYLRLKVTSSTYHKYYPIFIYPECHCMLQGMALDDPTRIVSPSMYDTYHAFLCPSLAFAGNCCEKEKGGTYLRGSPLCLAS
eukprot:gnl/Carplike_NY0171/4346_a5897_183.p1 GENE.gnl/Carplike_NY0171/4346_a5897_183~~gnl/Carplike_NY0171/4346_a5897_183.p1  ORF type:complete len:133 (+),score=11.72 gnl/Carplike_NY0171/4346_a5897_183:1191-1589(+)